MIASPGIFSTPKNPQESRLISELLKKMKLNFKTMTDDEIEDAGMGILMKKGDRTKKVRRDAVMKKLNRKGPPEACVFDKNCLKS